MRFRQFMTRPEARYARRLAFMVLWLALFDPFVPTVLERLEKRRYEGAATFRFQSSDLFGIGPLVSYLREHPRGDRPRVAFFGNSMIFGYGLDTADTIPGAYERQQPTVRVFNAAINGEALGTNYLIAKSIIDSVDVLYVQVVGEIANPLLPSRIPIDDADARAFHLPAPDPIEARLTSAIGRVWRLYGAKDRLQAALFGTSTRNVLYRRAKELVARVAPRNARPETAGRIGFRAPLGAPASSLGQKRVMLAFGDLARSHRKRIVFLEFEYGGRRANDARIAEFNALYAPYAEIVVLTIPPQRTLDGMHPTRTACGEIASLLIEHERQRTR